MIIAGVLAALLMNTLVFPRHCRVNTDHTGGDGSLRLIKCLSDAIFAKREPHSRLVESAVPDAQQVLVICPT
jgi:hypothetical protein